MEANEIVNKMMSHDSFSQWLGIKVVDIQPSYCKLSMIVRNEMLNGFGIAHGGITYSLADSALAFASNSNGRKSVSIETSVSHLVSLVAGDEIIAEGSCESETEKLGHYRVRIYKMNNQEKIVALFKGIVYKTSEKWSNQDL